MRCACRCPPRAQNSDARVTFSAVNVKIDIILKRCRRDVVEVKLVWSEGSQQVGSASALVEEGTNEAIAPSATTPLSSRLQRLLCRHC
jgi:hypothetical protein